MGKGIGLIGNFKGKVGNTVGYKLTASNNGQTQGIRVYQPIVKNPKTAGQAEQRAKLLAVNATYRALKMVIDRGNEGLPYGNKSRLAWLKTALKAEKMPWIEKGAAVKMPVLCQLTKGSLASIADVDSGDANIQLSVSGATADTKTVDALSTLILAQYSTLKNGDQLTFIEIVGVGDTINARVASLVIDTTSKEAIAAPFTCDEDYLHAWKGNGIGIAGTIIVSRQGDNGEHLRSTDFLSKLSGYDDTVLADAAKTAAIASYRASAASNSDWAEESIQ